MKKKHVVAFLATLFLLLAILIPALAQSTGPIADTLRVGDATGKSGTVVEVPVTITNVANGPIQGIRLSIDYNKNVLSLTDIRQGDLTSNWTHLQVGTDKHTMVIATAYKDDALPNGSSGSVVRLKFKVIGSPGTTSPMKISLVELSNPDGIVGTAPARHGTFTVTSTTSMSTTPPPTVGGGGGGGYFVPPTTPTPKPTSRGVEEVEVVAPSSPPSSPGITPSAAPVQTPIPALAAVPKTPPLFVLLIVIGVIVVTGIIIMVLRR